MRASKHEKKGIEKHWQWQINEYYHLHLSDFDKRFGNFHQLYNHKCQFH